VFGNAEKVISSIVSSEFKVQTGASVSKLKQRAVFLHETTT
jgi:hypothetical protein